ncbi:hypothetical protein GWI33_018916 [Rhynchophorus ferrugineus]|uniref:Uncharacterized protein n=1 Tax=Rhynchophorus ferrugineus TaxID=354439 RepID=A0A834I6E0_RHYFE|nr:hypothetical protein GWI33_018916 [Rhynchophorus ferrugineus]
MHEWRRSADSGIWGKGGYSGHYVAETENEMDCRARVHFRRLSGLSDHILGGFRRSLLVGSLSFRKTRSIFSVGMYCGLEESMLGDFGEQ